MSPGDTIQAGSTTFTVADDLQVIQVKDGPLGIKVIDGQLSPGPNDIGGPPYRADQNPFGLSTGVANTSPQPDIHWGKGGIGRVQGQMPLGMNDIGGMPHQANRNLPGSINANNNVLPIEGGEVKTETLLNGSPESLAFSLNKQLGLTVQEDLVPILNHFPKEERALATSILQKQTQFGRMEDFNSIVHEAIRQRQKIYAPGDSSLAANLYYLFQKKAKGQFENPTTGLMEKIPTDIWTTKLEPRTVVVLDEMTLHKLKTDPVFLNDLQSLDITFVLPEGFEKGINPFTQLNAEKIQEALSETMKRTKKLQKTNQELGENEAISEALNEYYLTALESLGIKKPIEIIQSGISRNTKPSAQSITERINPNTIAVEDIAPLLHSKMHLGPEATSDSIISDQLYLLGQEARVYSPRILGEKLQQLYLNVIEEAQASGVTPKEVYYLVPKEHKSYGMMTMIYRLVNEIEPSQIVQKISQIPVNKKTMLVVLDDISGSGNSLHYLSKAIDESDYKGPVTLAPVVSIDSDYNIMNGDVLDIDKIKPLGFSETFERLALACKSSSFFRDLLGGSENYNPTGTKNVAIAFPYMAPDNTCNLFAGLCQLFTLNKVGISADAQGADHALIKSDINGNG